VLLAIVTAILVHVVMSRAYDTADAEWPPTEPQPWGEAAP
jgi:hypothetical protein